MRNAADLRISKVGSGKNRFRKQLLGHIDKHNRGHVGSDGWRSLEFQAKEGGKFIGGVYGNTYWDWLFISVLWVHEKHRQKMIGRRLMEAAEMEARKRKCKFAHLDSFTFQAPEFYKKLGYKVFGTLRGLPKKHSRVFLWKRL